VTPTAPSKAPARRRSVSHSHSPSKKKLTPSWTCLGTCSYYLSFVFFLSFFLSFFLLLLFSGAEARDVSGGAGRPGGAAVRPQGPLGASGHGRLRPQVRRPCRSLLAQRRIATSIALFGEQGERGAAVGHFTLYDRTEGT